MTVGMHYPTATFLLVYTKKKNFIWVSNLLAFYNLVGFQKVKKKIVLLQDILHAHIHIDVQLTPIHLAPPTIHTVPQSPRPAKQQKCDKCLFHYITDHGGINSHMVFYILMFESSCSNFRLHKLYHR